jgi:hypothetical protein
MSIEDDQIAARELILFADNDASLYRQMTVPIHKNLATKRARGQYDGAKAVTAFMHLAEAAAKRYAREHGSDEWHVMFPSSVRRLAATHWARSFEEEARLGNYDDLLPQKYQKPARASQRSKLYRSGQELAQKASSMLSQSEIAAILRSGQPYYPTRRSKPNKERDRGYLDYMQHVLDAMEGN